METYEQIADRKGFEVLTSLDAFVMLRVLSREISTARRVAMAFEAVGAPGHGPASQRCISGEETAALDILSMLEKRGVLEMVEEQLLRIYQPIRRPGSAYSGKSKPRERALRDAEGEV
jgi:hypothetical protein